VAWKVFAERGIARRGPSPDQLGLDTQPHLLTEWNLGNLDSYWRPWAERHRRTLPTGFRVRPRWSTAWGMLGPPRLHCTITTGEVVSKEQAGRYALDTFDARWHPLIAEAIRWCRREPGGSLSLSPDERRWATTDFVLEVVADAHRVAAPA
jgi:hypothetical protein